MNNKKVIIALALLFGMAFGFSLTFAYNTDEVVMANKFKLAEWKTVYTENFESPSNWITCETVDKTITVKNESDVDVAARLKLAESWIDEDGHELPLTSATSGHKMAQIQYLRQSGWTENADGYFYYNTDLGENETTRTLTTGVTLNCDANLAADTDYANATYRLAITAQTIQADAKSAWQ